MSFTFNGISSDSKNVIVEQYPSRPVASKVRQTVSIPGRNGLLVYAGGDYYENVHQVYDCYLKGGALDTKIADVLGWLQGPDGYARLEDSYDTTHFRQAMYVGGGEIESVWHQFGRAPIEFSCKPERWLISGETVTSWATTGGKSVSNPTAFTAKPLIRIHGSGTITLVCGGSTVKVTGLTTSRDIYIDSELEDCYNGTTNMGDMVQVTGGYPKLAPGTNLLTRSGGSSVTVYLTPRWWEL